MEQCLFFGGYSWPNINSNAPLKISVNISFPANFFYSSHLIKLKLDL